MDRAAALRAAGMLERKERGGEAAGPAVRGLPAVRSTLQQCGLLQDLIDISLSNLRGLRTKCAASNDLTQQEIRTLEVRSRGSPAAGMRRSWGRALPPAPGAALPHRCPGRWGGGEPLPLSPRAEGCGGTRKGSRKGDQPPPHAGCGASPSCHGPLGPLASRHPAGRARWRCPWRGKARRGRTGAGTAGRPLCAPAPPRCCCPAAGLRRTGRLGRQVRGEAGTRGAFGLPGRAETLHPLSQDAGCADVSRGSLLFVSGGSCSVLPGLSLYPWLGFTDLIRSSFTFC